ncbi:transposase [Streptomyces sp. S1D4-11]
MAGAAGTNRPRRQRAGLPDQVRHKEKWRLALEILDKVRDQWELPDLPVVSPLSLVRSPGWCASSLVS